MVLVPAQLLDGRISGSLCGCRGAGRRLHHDAGQLLLELLEVLLLELSVSRLVWLVHRTGRVDEAAQLVKLFGGIALIWPLVRRGATAWIGCHTMDVHGLLRLIRLHSRLLWARRRSCRRGGRSCSLPGPPSHVCTFGSRRTKRVEQAAARHARERCQPAMSARVRLGGTSGRSPVRWDRPCGRLGSDGLATSAKSFYSKLTPVKRYMYM